MSTKQLTELGVVNVPLTVSRIRSQRSGCVQVSAQYLFVYRALIDFALARDLLPPGSEAAAMTAVRQLTGPSPQPLRLPMPNATGSLPTDSSLLSILAASINSDGSFCPANNADPTHFTALMRFLRCHLTTYELLSLLTFWRKPRELPRPQS